jgi:hypothetical protein
MSLAASFDKHPHIEYRDLTRLYWSEYAFRVGIEIPPRRRNRFKSKFSLSIARDKLLGEVVHDTDLVYRATTGGFNFFFSDRAEAESFIDSNAELIHEVVRPVYEDEIELLRDPKIRIRDRLFFDRYGWCVTFVTTSWREDCATAADIDQFVFDTIFPDGSTDEENTERARYRPRKNGTRRLYLASESDVVLVKLSVDDTAIGAIECAKLRQQPSE